MVYQHDPEALPDDAFEPGELTHLVVGNTGRLLDARRTPVRLERLDLELGQLTVEILAFEDAGARWTLPLERVGRFQFARDSRRADPQQLQRFRDLIEAFDRPLVIGPDPGSRERTLTQVGTERLRLRARLDALGLPAQLDPRDAIRTRQGDPLLTSIARQVLTDEDLLDLDDGFAESYVSNPWSGELVKGHAIVAAELGLCRYAGTVVRDPDLFAGPWSRTRRAKHLITRLALTAELWSRAGEDVTLYRGGASDTALTARGPGLFASATFSREVALEHFEGGPHTRAAYLLRLVLPVQSLLMTFWETPALSRRFLEAEAVLLELPPTIL